MDKQKTHSLLAVTGEFLELLHDYPRITAPELRAQAMELGRRDGTLLEIEAWRRDPTGFDEVIRQDLILRVDAFFAEGTIGRFSRRPASPLRGCSA